ncbi:MAG: endonuclease domain-containing protein [Polyangiales bacterium]
MARRSVLAKQAGADRHKLERARQLRRAMTEAEDRLWGALCGRSLGCRARTQHVIRGWIVDFYIASARLVIEVDGDVHDMQLEEDQRRSRSLEDEGLRVLRFRNDEVLRSLPWVIARICEEIHGAQTADVPASPVVGCATRDD